MKKYLLVGLVLFSNYVFALFEDEEARKKINDMQDQLNNIEKSLEFKINQKFSKQLGLDETKVCRHGPFSHLSRLSKTCIKFPLTVYAPWGEDVIEDRHGRNRALEDLRVFVDICQKEGYNARIPLHWLSKEGNVNVH